MTCDTLDQCRTPNKDASAYLAKATDADLTLGDGDGETPAADIFADFNAMTVDGSVTVGADTAWTGVMRPWFGYSNKLNRMMLR